MKTILITCGDVDGIGYEIVSKSLHKISITKPFRVVVFRSRIAPKNWSRLYQKKVIKSVSSFSELEEYLAESKKFGVIDFVSEDSPVDWVEQTTNLCRRHPDTSLVNAPLSKTLIADSGRKDHGHTDIFKRLCGVNSVNMAFFGKKFSVILATDHIPLSEVEKNLSDLYQKLSAIDRFRSLLGSNKSAAVLGVNPHAGEKGVIGNFEDRYLEPKFVSYMKTHKISGPFPADSFFANSTWKSYPIVFAMYHDQGLVPFKMAHADSPSVHITLGIPFLRTSVDHGTAKDIANKGIADFSSMLEAIKLNMKLSRTYAGG